MRNPKVENVAVSTLIIDPRVQRPLDKRRVSKIAAELNMDALGVITVSRRDNGDNAVIDGQHRVEALREAGHGGGTAACRVFADLTLPEEADMFRLLNNTAKPGYLDLFRVRVIQGDEDAVMITLMLEQYGWKVAQAGDAGCLSAIQAFERVYRASPAAAEKTIATITRAWGHDRNGVDGRLLDGLGLVYARYGEAINVSELTDRLSKYAGGPGALLGKSRGLSDLIGVTVGKAVAEVVVELYNRLRKTKGLPAWRAS
jgi:hypothetical protein